MSEDGESPHARLLGQEFGAVARDGHKETLALIDSLSKYGADLVIRGFHSSPREMEDVLVLCILLKQVVAMLDGIRVVTENAALMSAPLQLRAMLEASLYIDWILKADTRVRANAYYVGEVRRRREYNRRIHQGEFDQYCGDASTAEMARIKQQAAQEEIADSRLLAEPALAPVDAAFVAQRGKRKYDPSWHEIVGGPNVRQIAIDLGRLDEYEGIYSPASWTMHAVNLSEHVKFKADGEVAIFAIRNPHIGSSLANNLFGAAVMLVLRTYQSVLTKYRPGEEARFAQKYLGELRALTQRRGL